MERTCPVCSTVVDDDTQAICTVCGADLPPVEEIESMEELDLGELENGDSGRDEHPAEPEHTEGKPEKGDWDMGVVGAGKGMVEEEAPEVQEPAPDETPSIPEKKREADDDEYYCPSCNGLVKIGSKRCPNCSLETQYLKRCPVCAFGIDQLAEICPSCYTDFGKPKEVKTKKQAVPESSPASEVSAPAEAEAVPETAASEDVAALEEGKNGKLPEKEKKKMLKRLQKEQRQLEKRLEKGEITEEEFQKRLDEIRLGNGFGPIGGYVLDEAEKEKKPDVKELEEGQNGKLSEKEKKKMLKRLLKEQRELEKQLEKGEITEAEFQKRLDEIRLGNGFGPIGGYVLEEAEAAEAEEDEEAEPMDTGEARARRKEMMKEILAEERKGGFFNYYNLSLITLFFFIFLAVFVFFEFVFMVSNITTQSGVPRVAFSIMPSLGNVIGVPVILFCVIVTIFDAILHFWDRKLNLMLSFVPTWVMIIGLSVDVTFHSQFVGADLLWIFLLLGLLFFMFALDILCILWYPSVLNAQDRGELALYLEKEEEISEVEQTLEEEYQKMIEEEEEKLKMKNNEINEIQTKLDELNSQIQQEEEKLRLKEEEISAIKSELDLKTQEMAEEEEKLKMKEEEMESLIQTELEKRAEDMMLEEEEKLRIKEEELVKAKSELDIQKNLFDENREKLRMKEQEMMSLRTELENQLRLRMEEEDKLRLKEAAAKLLERGKQKRVLFPFTAMVGQEKMKRALILNAIYPEVGGVLIRGQKGTGKSVSVRGLAEILPDIEVTGCKFNCDPAEPDKFCNECKAKHEAGRLETYKRPVQVVDLPLNITEDRLVGSIDIEKILTEGVKSFEPGILAEAHRGILYVDEINLLDDYIVDILLDSASSGVVTIEREGISVSHPSRFIIVGSMNPEEGELRPQILDRLALQTDVIGIKEVDQRIDIVKRREEFTSDPEGFRDKYEGQRVQLRDKIQKAQALMPNVTTPPRIYNLIAQICLDFNVDGHRADIIIERAARANAAFENRVEVTAEDVVVGADMALPHRMRRRPYEEEEFGEETLRKIVKAREAEIE
jgi:Mg-chelatase subunit ChlI